MRSSSAIVLALAAAACGSHHGPTGPHARSSQQPIESACERDTEPLSRTGLVVRTSFERDTRVRARIENRAAKTRIVSPRSIELCAGPCAGRFAECERLKSWESDDVPAYAVSLAPGEALELDVDATLPHAASSCEKVGLRAVLTVDSDSVCADLGRWIARAR